MEPRENFDQLMRDALQDDVQVPSALQAETLQKIRRHEAKNTIPWYLFAVCGCMQTLALLAVGMLCLPDSRLAALLFVVSLGMAALLIICAFVLSRAGHKSERKGDFLCA